MQWLPTALTLFCWTLPLLLLVLGGTLSMWSAGPESGQHGRAEAITLVVTVLASPGLKVWAYMLVARLAGGVRVLLVAGRGGDERG